MVGVKDQFGIVLISAFHAMTTMQPDWPAIGFLESIVSMPFKRQIA